MPRRPPTRGWRPCEHVDRLQPRTRVPWSPSADGRPCTHSQAHERAGVHLAPGVSAVDPPSHASTEVRNMTQRDGFDPHVGSIPPERSEPERPKSPVISDRARKDWPVLLAAAPVVVAASRVIGFSRGDQALLTTLLQTLDVPAVLIGSLMPTATTLLGILAYLAIGDPGLSQALLRGWRSLSVPATAAVFLAVCLLVSVSDLRALGATIALLAIAGLLRALLSRRARSEGRSWLGFGGDSMAVAAALLVPLLLNGSMWLPSESVRLADGTQVRVYVLAVETDWTTMLRAKDRKIVRLPSAEVIGREVCNESPVRTLAQLNWHTPAQPQCS